MPRTAIVILFILLVLAAIVLVTRAAPPAVLGGAVAWSLGGAPALLAPPGQHPRELHPVGVALERYARGLGPEHVLAVHPLERERYEPLQGAAVEGGAKKSPPRPLKKWTGYQTWDKMAKDQGALAEYYAQRAAALNRPEFDWSPVLREIAPHLAENREYIGIAVAEDDGKTLRVAAYEASPTSADDETDLGTFAGVPSELVAKYAEKPGLFLFHTHPADPRASPTPSSHDISSAISLSALGRFAASVVISRYGVIAYGIDWDGYKRLNSAKNWSLALANFTHDAIVAHESIRSWVPFTNQEYFDMYRRYGIWAAVWPSAMMTADSHAHHVPDLEGPVDHEFIEEARGYSKKYEERSQKPRT